MTITIDMYTNIKRLVVSVLPLTNGYDAVNNPKHVTGHWFKESPMSHVFGHVSHYKSSILQYKCLYPDQVGVLHSLTCVMGSYRKVVSIVSTALYEGNSKEKNSPDDRKSHVQYCDSAIFPF